LIHIGLVIGFSKDAI